LVQNILQLGITWNYVGVAEYDCVTGEFLDFDYMIEVTNLEQACSSFYFGFNKTNIKNNVK
jgi:hypothetical protein